MSGTHYLAHKKFQFITFEKLTIEENYIHLDNYIILSIYRQGNIEIFMINGETIWLNNILYVLNLYKNLFLISDHDI